MNQLEKDVTQALQRYERFGIDLGLDRILWLLEQLGSPHRRVPILHVAGTNGKGSVCAYLSAILTAAGYRVGRYTSPHLVHWTERICINEQPIAADRLLSALAKLEAVIDAHQPSPTQFEVLTAAAWTIFAEANLDVAVIEVGLGGRLDATNVCDHPLASIITSLSREHWQRLGPTLAHIAREKAGILKAGRPAIIGPLPDEAAQVVRERIAALGCPAIWPSPAQLLPQEERSEQGYLLAKVGQVTYPLPLLGEVQQTNSALAIATIEVLQTQGWDISTTAIQTGMAQARWPGRLQYSEWQGMQLLIDGAHNPAAAKALRQYVDQVHQGSVCWLMGMLSTKDHADIFQALLRPGDRLKLVPVPDHSSAEPAQLATLAQSTCEGLASCDTAQTLIEGLQQLHHTATPNDFTVLCGSLYLVGEFLRLSHLEGAMLS